MLKSCGRTSSARHKDPQRNGVETMAFFGSMVIRPSLLYSYCNEVDRVSLSFGSSQLSGSLIQTWVS
jgi:hypothetical protein